MEKNVSPDYIHKTKGCRDINMTKIEKEIIKLGGKRMKNGGGVITRFKFKTSEECQEAYWSLCKDSEHGMYTRWEVLSVYGI